MAKILLIGASSAIAQALQENSDKEFITLSRSAGTLDLEGDLAELNDLGPISGMVYFMNHKSKAFCNAKRGRLSC